jgi:membrane-bound inhibitor of C-type lysozyme
MVLETPLSSFDPANSTSVRIDLSAEVLQGLLQNITISLLTLANANLTTEVTTRNYVTKYQFAFQEKLIVPYASALAISFLIVVSGLRALAKNGVSASGAGFLQLLCTTKGSKAVDKMARAGSLGGNENVPKELENLVVRFGELRDRSGVKAGFGVADEVRNLVKGRNYR